jgi:hypothetical protein
MKSLSFTGGKGDEIPLPTVLTVNIFDHKLFPKVY